MTGGYLDFQVRNVLSRPIRAFDQYVFRDLIRRFDGLGYQAHQIAEEHYERAASRPAGEDTDVDLGACAEDAQDRALGWFEMMRSLHQTMLNLLASGLFHLVEQQLAKLSHDASFLGCEGPKGTDLGNVAAWYKSRFRLDLHGLPSWGLIDELRLVANTVKHGEGASSRKLKDRRPEIFRSTVFADYGDDDVELQDKLYLEETTRAPLAGEGFFVSEALLKEYAEGADRFFIEIADHFAAHERDPY